MFLSRGDRDLGVAFQTHPGRQAFISSGSKEPRSALESRRVSLGAHWVDSRESSLLRRLERGRAISLPALNTSLARGPKLEVADGIREVRLGVYRTVGDEVTKERKDRNRRMPNGTYGGVRGWGRKAPAYSINLQKPFDRTPFFKQRGSTF